MVLLQSNVGGSGRAAAAALAGLCASDQGRTIAAALSGKQLAEAAPRLLLAADVQDPVASTNAATVVAQLLHRGGAPAALNAARSGGLLKACALLGRNLPTQAHIAAIDLIVMMCNALGSGGGQLSNDEMQAIQSIVKFGLHRSWEQGDNGRPIFARAAAACAVLSVDPRRGRVISGATPLLLAALRHPVIISSHQQQQQVVGGWNPRKVMLDILLCVGRLCQDDEAALLAVGNGALPALFGLLGHTEQNVVGFALQALHALSTPGRRSRSAVIATGGRCLASDNTSQIPHTSRTKHDCGHQRVEKSCGCWITVGSRVWCFRSCEYVPFLFFYSVSLHSSLNRHTHTHFLTHTQTHTKTDARALTDALYSIISRASPRNASSSSSSSLGATPPPPKRQHSGEIVDGATQVLAHMCVADDGVWSYIRTKKYIEAAASLLRDKLTQVQACSTLVGMCSDDEELLERLIHSTSWSFVLRLLSPSSSIQAQHTALQLVLVASNREKLRSSILAAIDVNTLLALLTCNEDVARVAALATFNNLCDVKSGGEYGAESWLRDTNSSHFDNFTLFWKSRSETPTNELWVWSPIR